MHRNLFSGVVLVVSLLAFTGSAAAQGLNWEGQTGAFITPFAYTSASPAKGFGKPQLSFHFLDAGSVIGGYSQASATVGFFKVVEVGYTRAFVASGSTAGLSPLFSGGYNTFHGKVNFLPESLAAKAHLPALAVGFVARNQVRHVGGVLSGSDTNNGDIYLVATKTLTKIPGLPIVLNGGLKATNASIFAIAGNASAWQGRFFGAAAFVVKGPRGSVVILGSEFAQQPHFIEGLPGATVPTALTYFTRIIPAPERVPLALDFGLAQAIGNTAPGINLRARNKFAFGVSYQF